MKVKTNCPVAACLAAILLGTLTAGCAWSIGGKGRETDLIPTRGQELIDLKQAREQDAISQEEYEQTKKRILER